MQDIKKTLSSDLQIKFSPRPGYITCHVNGVMWFFLDWWGMRFDYLVFFYQIWLFGLTIRLIEEFQSLRQNNKICLEENKLTLCVKNNYILGRKRQ